MSKLIKIWQRVDEGKTTTVSIWDDKKVRTGLFWFQPRTAAGMKDNNKIQAGTSPAAKLAELDKSREQRRSEAAANLRQSRKERQECNSFESQGWFLQELEPQQNGERRWSMGKFGPRVYLTCDKETARMILKAVTLNS